MKNNTRIEKSGGMPELIPLPKGDIREYAEQKGLLKTGLMKNSRRRGPIELSTTPCLLRARSKQHGPGGRGTIRTG